MKDRKLILYETQSSQEFDVIVIGGGASGIGAALEASLRGYRTILLEKHDFTKGTSSKSTKLVHGGVRYMAQGDLKMVREALRERGYLIRNAPHLVHDQAFIIPNYRWWEGAFYTIGLKFYDLLAGKFSLGRSIHLGRKKVMEMLPGIKHENLKGGVLYHDGQFDDSRLAIDMLHAISKNGGLAINYMEVSGLIKDDNGKLSGVKAKDNTTSNELTLSANTIINATGVWVDDILEMDVSAHEKIIRPSQGIHLVLKKEFLPGSNALMIPKTSDGRVLFAVPWHDYLVVGTTDTPINDSHAEPIASEQEIKFILDTASLYFKKEIKRSDVQSVFAGLRPLAAPKKDSSKTKEISRNHKIYISESNLITVVGGKWTTYRKMGQDMIDAAIKAGLLPASESVSKVFKISGRGSKKEGGHFALYGDNAPEIEAGLNNDPEMAKRIHPELPYCWAEVYWICEHEMIVHLEDLLARRLRAILLNARATMEIAEEVAGRIKPIMKWSDEDVNKELDSFKIFAENYIL